MKLINGKLQIDRNSAVENKKVIQYSRQIQQEQQPIQQEQQPIPMTKEQYQRYRMTQYIKHVEQQKRIAQIKSKKLMFSSSTGVRVIPNNLNNLGRMHF